MKTLIINSSNIKFEYPGAGEIENYRNIISPFSKIKHGALSKGHSAKQSIDLLGYEVKKRCSGTLRQKYNTTMLFNKLPSNKKDKASVCPTTDVAQENLQGKVKNSRIRDFIKVAFGSFSSNTNMKTVKKSNEKKNKIKINNKKDDMLKIM